MMDSPTCKTCIFFDRYGKCRRRAPSPMTHFPQAVGYRVEVIWPYVLESDWCGEHPAYAGYVSTVMTTATKEGDR